MPAGLGHWSTPPGKPDIGATRGHLEWQRLHQGQLPAVLFQLGQNPMRIFGACRPLQHNEENDSAGGCRGEATVHGWLCVRRCMQVPGTWVQQGVWGVRAAGEGVRMQVQPCEWV